MSRRAATAALVACVAGMWPVSSGAQTTSGQIAGIINDTTGAAIASVDVDAVESASGRAWHVTSDAVGAYSFPALPAGMYQITARRTGMKTFTASRVELEINQIVRLDIVLDVGPLSERVDVIAEPVRLQTESTVVATTISAREAAALPIDGRNFIALTLLSPGAISVSPAGLNTGQRTASGGRPYINGNRKEANNFELDGVDANQTTDNLLAYQPSLDAIQELRIVTNNAPAEFGNYQGGIINATLKSGTNQSRGTLFEFLRRDALNAAGWAANWQPLDPLNPRRKAPMRHDVFGGTIGGPLIRNRAFFFADYQGTRRRDGKATSLVTLIPAPMRRGDFSALLTGPNPQQLYDPLTTRVDQEHPGVPLRDPFPGNQIPLDRINPVASALFNSSFYPTPSLAGLTQNEFNVTANTLTNDQYDVKIDAKTGARTDLSLRYAHGTQTTAATNSLPILLGSGTHSPFRAAAVQWTTQLSSSLFNEARFGLSRIVLLQDNGIDDGDLGALGDSIGIRGANRRGPGLPGLIFSAAASGIGSQKIVQDFTTNTLQYQDNLLWHHGHHTTKTGVLALRYQQDVYFSGNNGQLGLIEFNGQYTRDLNDPRSLGSPVADFLLGFPDKMVRGDYAETWQQRNTLWAGYAQDDWRLAPNVTANFGVRYEYRTPLVEVRNRQVNFDVATGRALYAGRDGVGRALYNAYKGDWQPRLGIAWTPARWRQRLVVRGAYSVSSYQEGTGTNLRLTLNPPFFNEFELINSNPAVVGPSVGTGFDALREKDPLVGTILRAWDPNLQPGRSQQWNVTIERQLAHEVAFTGGYVAQRGAHLVVPLNADQRPAPGAPRPLDAIYPQIAGVTLTTSIGHQQYDALQMNVRKRFANGWEFLSAYAWSRGMGDGRGFFSEGGQTAEPASFWPDPRNQNAEWGPLPFDARHTLTSAAIIDLPFGRGRRWLNNVPQWVDAVAGGWTMAAIWKAHTGFPITITAPDQSQTGARSGRPDQISVAEGPHEVGLGHLWFDTSAFVLPKLGTFGNAGVGVVRGPGLNVFDASVTKRVSRIGRAAIEVRADAFNVFNTPVFNAPDRSVTSSTFGQVLSSQLAREVQLSARLSF